MDMRSLDNFNVIAQLDVCSLIARSEVDDEPLGELTEGFLKSIRDSFLCP